MARRVVIYDDFSKGEYDLLTSDNAPKGSWTGRNMLVYSTGEIGVRAGFRNITPTGVVAGVVADFGVEGGGGAGQGLWYAQGDRIRRFNITNPGVGTVTNYTNTASGGNFNFCEHHHEGSTVYMATDVGVYSHSPTVLTTLNASLIFGGGIALLGDRLVVALNNTLRYSDAANFASWPAANVITVGDADAITGLRVQRTQLQIFKEHGGIYTLTGVPGVNETLRRTSRSKGPDRQRKSAVTLDEVVWYMTQNSNHPRRFDGAVSRMLPYLRTKDSGGVAFIQSRDIDNAGMCLFVAQQVGTAAIYEGPQAAYLRNGVWTYHDFGIEIPTTSTDGPMGTSINLPYANAQDPISGIRYGETLCFAISGGVTGLPAFYAWTPSFDRPGSEYAMQDATVPGMAPERAGDGSSEQVTGRFSMPEWWADEGSEIMVRGVIVDFKTWDTGGSLPNRFDVSVDTLRRWDNSSPGTVAPLSWSESGSLASTTGTMRRETFSFGDQGSGNGFQLHFANVRGVSIRRIQVLVDSSPVRIP